MLTGMQLPGLRWGGSTLHSPCAHGASWLQLAAVRAVPPPGAHSSRETDTASPSPHSSNTKLLILEQLQISGLGAEDQKLFHC